MRVRLKDYDGLTATRVEDVWNKEAKELDLKFNPDQTEIWCDETQRWHEVVESDYIVQRRTGWVEDVLSEEAFNELYEKVSE